MNLAQVLVRLEGTAQKLALTGQVKSTLLVAADRPDITVHRRREEGAETLLGSEDLWLAPGDVVEIGLSKTDFAGAVASSHVHQRCRTDIQRSDPRCAFC